jgi:hypothetical protein
LYRSKRKDTTELVSYSSVQDVLDCVLLLEVGRTKRNVNVNRDNAIRTCMSKKLIGKITKVVESICISAVR